MLPLNTNIAKTSLHGRATMIVLCTTVLFSAMIGMGSILPVAAHPYQEKSAESYEQEQAVWREAIKRDPKNPDAYLELAESMVAEAGEGYWCTSRAVEVYRQAIAVVPPNAELHFRLGLDWTSELEVNCDEYSPTEIQTQKKEGLFHLRKAIELDPTKDRYYIALGDALKDQGQVDAAIAAYKTAISMPYKPEQSWASASTQAVSYIVIGDYLWENVADVEAVAAYRKAFAIAPDYPHLQKRLREVELALKLKRSPK
jgi:tetratricopeptide (TPR) repeat protein